MRMKAEAVDGEEVCWYVVAVEGWVCEFMTQP